MVNKLTIGKKGEQLACKFLEKKGYEILETNWRYNHLEIDLIATFENKLVVVEVKTRDAAFWENPEQVISHSKIRFLTDATEAYIEKNQLNMEVRFDVICLVMQGDEFEIDHIVDAFHPTIN